MEKNSKFFRVRADIDLSAIRTNIKNMQKRLAAGVKSCAVIKTDGYGHGSVPIAAAVQDLVDFYAAATMEEAVVLREHAITKPVLILGYVHPDYYAEAVKQEIRLTVFNYETALEISKTAEKLNKRAYIHIKLDTGMSRIGFLPYENSLTEITRISRLPNLVTEGLFTHLFLADGEDKTSALRQIELFRSFSDKLEALGVHFAIRHCSNSAASIDLPAANFDMVRMGISMYGLYPSEYVTSLKLEPAMSLKSHVVMVKTIPAGATVGYGATFTAAQDTRIATIPVGYGDGYPRNLSNRGSVLIHGHRAPIVGRVCMDQFMADVTDLPETKPFDEVTLVGKDLGEEITMEEAAGLARTFNYEFACDIGIRVPRVYYRDGKAVDCKNYFLDAYRLPFA